MDGRPLRCPERIDDSNVQQTFECGMEEHCRIPIFGTLSRAALRRSPEWVSSRRPNRGDQEEAKREPATTWTCNSR